jgi:hypothetical protein
VRRSILVLGATVALALASVAPVAANHPGGLHRLPDSPLCERLAPTKSVGIIYANLCAGETPPVVILHGL